MTIAETMENVNAVLSIRQHFENCRHCWNADGATEESTEWLVNSGHSLRSIVSLLDSQVWEVIPSVDLEDATREGWALGVVWRSSDDSVVLVHTC